MTEYSSGLAAFFAFINERHQIHLRRQAGKDWPWTRDPILQKYKFCSVFRELDRVTIWLRTNWREPYADHPRLSFAMAVARMINWPDTLAEIGFPDPWQPRRVARVIDDRIVRGETAFTSAYRGPLPHKDKLTRAEYVAHKVLDPLYRDPPPLQRARSLKRAWRMLMGRPGFGASGFMAYEVVSDLRWTRYLCDAPDTMTWANAGPGAVRGLNLIFGRLVDHRLHPEDALAEMQWLLEISPDYLGRHVPPLEMRDIEHSLCEWFKYARAKQGDKGKLERYRRPEPPSNALI